MNNNESKSVLIIGNFLSESFGTQGVCEQLAIRLAESGWRVTSASKKTARVSRLLDMTSTALINHRQFAVAHIDVFSGAAFFWAETVSWILTLLHCPYILTLHGGNLPDFHKRHSERVERLLRSATVVTTPSSYIQMEFSQIRSDIVLLRNAIDLEQYTSYHRPQPRPRLAWLRAFHSIYSPITAVEALAVLVDDFPDIELTMFGPEKADGLLKQLQQRVKQPNMAGRIHIPGPIPKSEVPHKLGDFDIFLNTTTAESFGVSVVEAAALGMCIVTTNVGELPYIWTHERDALLVPPNDPQAMADAIRRILTEPGLAERLSRNARKTAEQFDWSAILPQWEELLLDVIEGHQRG